MGVIAEIAEAVVTELNAGTFAPAFTADRRYAVVRDVKELTDGVKVSVSPQASENALAGRNSVQRDVTVQIGVQKKLSAADNAEIDELMDLVETIAVFLEFQPLDGCPRAVWLRTGNEPIYAAEHLRNYRVFTSVIQVTYRVLSDGR